MLSGFFVTKKGKNLLAKTHDGANIELTRAEIGSGDIPEGQLVTEVTSLYGKVKELPLGEVKVGSGKEVCIPVQLTNKGVLTSFLFKEIGVYAIDPDEGEILYLYGNTDVTGDVPDEVKSESESQVDYLFNLLLNIDNTTKVDVNVDNSLIYATLQNLSDMADTKVDKVSGKGLSTEDYTTAEKNKLAGIAAGANKYVHPSTHPVGMITGLGTAATENTGTSSGNVPVIESNGKLPAVIIPSDDGKQDKLTFDTSPKSGSTNPVTSAGIYTALAGKANSKHNQGHDTITFNPEANKEGDVFLLDRGYVDTAGACRTAFMPADAITVEYTQDGGMTWKPYNLTDAQKQGLFSMNRSFFIKLGGPNATAQTIGHGVRITVEPVDRYTNVDTFYCWFSSASSSTKCSIERSTIEAKNTFTTIRSNVPVIGSSGPNSITFAAGSFGGSADQTSNFYSYRFTFITTAISTTETTVPKVTDLRLYGSKVWRMPNQMMFDGHLYSWDTAQNATFPAQLKAPAIYDSGQRVYSPSNKPTAADVGALPMDGGTLAGELVPNGGLAHAGIDGYIAYPDGGQYISSIQNVTGMLKITLPVSWTNTMLKFKVSICNSRNKTHAEYIISGYNIENRWSFFDAYCLSPWGGVLSNLPVSFGHDGSKCAITIGTPTTVWNYPQVVISDIMMGYSNTSYDMWKSGWNISFITEALPTVSTTIANTNIGYNVRRADGAATADKVANKLTIGSKTYDGSVAVTLTSEDLSGGATGQTWHAKDILGSGTTSTADATAESGYSVTIDTTAKSLNGSVKKYKAPFGTYVAIFRVQASTVTGSADKVKLEIWGTSAAIASRTLKLSDFSVASKWEYFKIPFETDSSSGRDIYPKVTCLNATGNVKVDNIVVVPNAFALM